MRAEREPWLVPMRIARFRRLHFSTSGVNVCRSRMRSSSVIRTQYAQETLSPVAGVACNTCSTRW